MAREVSALIPIFGSNRTLAYHVGEQLRDCEFVVVPFCGGACELRHLSARTVIVGDKHRHIINLAQQVGCPVAGPALVRRLRRKVLHEVELCDAQRRCKEVEEKGEHPLGRGAWAEDYFVCAWMTRSGVAGTRGEFDAGLSVRWDAGGGDSATRYRSAVESLRDWRRVFRCCTFLVRDCFDLLAEARQRDRTGHGVYADPTFPGVGAKYKHNPGTGGSAEERAFHVRLRDELEAFEHTRVVCRFYDHPLVRELYTAPRWHWLTLSGGKTQTNAAAPEVLLVNAEPLASEKGAA